MTARLAGRARGSGWSGRARGRGRLWNPLAWQPHEGYTLCSVRQSAERCERSRAPQSSAAKGRRRMGAGSRGGRAGSFGLPIRRNHQDSCGSWVCLVSWGEAFGERLRGGDQEGQPTRKQEKIQRFAARPRRQQVSGHRLTPCSDFSVNLPDGGTGLAQGEGAAAKLRRTGGGPGRGHARCWTGIRGVLAWRDWCGVS